MLIYSLNYLDCMILFKAFSIIGIKNCTAVKVARLIGKKFDLDEVNTCLDVYRYCIME